MSDFLFILLLVLLSFFWFIRTVKAVLFWLYLWQLKEYHIGRFIDHFRTAKGKQLFLDPLNAVKAVIFFALFIIGRISVEPGFFDTVLDLILISSIFLFLIVYLLEGTAALKSYLSGRLIKPVFTVKIRLLVFILFGITAGFLFFAVLPSRGLPAQFLIFDILVPVAVSVVTLFLQPFAVLARSRIIQKAKQKREQFPNLLAIGITGSYGKTSTKEFLYTILAERFGENKVLKTKEHQNSEVGISQCILNDLRPEHEIFIVEMGAYNKGGIKILCDIAKPKIGILTGISEQHMATFGSQENIIKAKYELIESLPPDGTAFFNAKNKYCVELYNQTKIKKFLYGQDAKIFGEENLLGAIAAAKELGATMEVKPPYNKPPYNFLPIKRGINGLNIIDSTYSANPTGVITHLDYLKTLPGNPEGEPSVPYGARKILVMPCLIELGQASKEVHRRIGAKIVEVCDLAIITTKDRFKEIRETAGEKVIFIDSAKEIFNKLKSTTTAGDVVLLESHVPKELINLLNV